MIEAEQIARVMFKAICEKTGWTEIEATHACGDDHHQYMEEAQKIVDVANDYPDEMRAVARYLLERVNPSALEAISLSVPKPQTHMYYHQYNPPSRVLP